MDASVFELEMVENMTDMGFLRVVVMPAR